MGIPPRHIGDSIDVELLHEISKLLDKMEQIICCRFFTTTADYSEIINMLNYLTDSNDTIYTGDNPTLPEMEIILDEINGEII